MVKAAFNSVQYLTSTGGLLLVRELENVWD
jgi:hypothetical protein